MTAAAAIQRGASNRYYLLGLCCASYFLCYADRQLFSVLMPPLREEFALSDTELGLLSGLAFGVFYTALSLPLARLTDRGSRKWMLVACMTLWSAATALCAVAKNTLHLALVRMGVAVGEAGGFPASISAIADLFPKTQRATAISFYTMAGSIGGAAALPIGGWIASEYGWRMAFLAVGAPGLFLALITALSFREPVRGAADGESAENEPTPPLLHALGYMTRNRAYVLLCVGAAASAGVVSALQWLPSFFERSHGLSLVEAGGFIGLALLISSPIGQLVGGQVADRLAKTSMRLVFYAMAAAALIAGLLGLVMVAAPSVLGALVAVVGWKIAVTTFPPPAFAMAQSLVDVRMRATSQAVILMGINLVGYGGGPTLTGWLSELIRPQFGVDSLRVALAVSVGGLSAIAALANAFGGRALRRTPRLDLLR